jgi:hypothetical protein
MTGRTPAVLRADLEKFIIAASVAAWRDLIEQDKGRGGDGKLRDMAISLTRGRTRVTLHCDYSDDARMLSAGFVLPEPLPDVQVANGEFLLNLHEWLEGRQPAPKLFTPDPQGCETLH